MRIAVSLDDATELLACVRAVLAKLHPPNRGQLERLETTIWTRVRATKTGKKRIRASFRRGWETRRRNKARMGEASGAVLGMGQERPADIPDGERPPVPHPRKKRSSGDGEREAKPDDSIQLVGAESLGPDSVKIESIMQMSKEAKEKLPWEDNPNLKECLMCNQYKEDVTTRPTPAGDTYSCGSCHADIIQFWKEQENG